MNTTVDAATTIMTTITTTATTTGKTSSTTSSKTSSKTVTAMADAAHRTVASRIPNILARTTAKIVNPAIDRMGDKARANNGVPGLANNRTKEAGGNAKQQKPRGPDQRQQQPQDPLRQQQQGQPRQDLRQQQQKQKQNPNMWQYRGEHEVDLDMSDDDEVLEDAPLEEEELALESYLLEDSQQRLRQQPGVFGPRDQTVQAWQQQQQQQQQQQGSAYEEWVQGHHRIVEEGSDDWERGQRCRLEEQRESLYHLYCEAERIQAQNQQAHQAQSQEARQHSSPQQQHSPPQPQHSPLQQQLSSPQTSPLPAQPPATPNPQPTPPPKDILTPPSLPSPATHPQKLLTLLLFTTALQQTLQNTFSLLTAHELTLAQHEHRAPQLGQLEAFFNSLHAAVDRVTDRLDALWRSAYKADENGGCFRLVGRQAQEEFCAEWEGVVAGYGEVLGLEGGVFSSSASSSGVKGRAGEEWEGYLGALGRFEERVRAFVGERLRGF
ncbi:hypothetical protein C8A01DRAFT_37558 [Parachaetomium inaequale]|uniref:Uncharacterized protein n=1 Tax=Parachaetomium inaequale TaxID=2588326 RepID=A0AAN6PED8_9PEZI|nr:hypothetical protein C8A01DRAFT_37558 [Parachaetomium inaequale]